MGEEIVQRRIFVAATRQNDGKTTISLGLIKAFRKRFNKVGFIKPVGQRYVFDHGYNMEIRYLQPWTLPAEPINISGFLLPLGLISIIIGMSALLRKSVPKFYSILTGGRGF